MTTRAEWAAGLLAYAGWDLSLEKIVGLVAQGAKEGSGAVWNMLDTTEPAPGASDYNSAGVKNYPSEAAGYAATLATFTNGHYPQLVAILSDPTGGSAVAYATSPDLNTWGTGNCLAQVESIKAGDPFGYMTATVADGGAPAPAPAPPSVNRRGSTSTMGTSAVAVRLDGSGVDVVALTPVTASTTWQGNTPYYTPGDVVPITPQPPRPASSVGVVWVDLDTMLVVVALGDGSLWQNAMHVSKGWAFGDWEQIAP